MEKKKNAHARTLVAPGMAIAINARNITIRVARRHRVKE